MSLPKFSVILSFLKNQKLESLILPGMIVFIFCAILLAAVLIPKHNQKQTEKDIALFTEPNKVKVHGGKTLEVAPTVKQMAPELLNQALAANQELVVIQVFSGDEWKEPHIKGSILMKKSDFDNAPANIDKEKYYVYVSADGYDSAEAIAKLLGYGYSYDKNVNLEGGLKAWKEKGYKLEL